jgi:hypothetical protein
MTARVPSQHLRMTLPLPLKQFLSPNPLAVVEVPDFEPSGLLFWQVRRVLVLGYDAFEVSLTSEPEQPRTIPCDVVTVK